MRLMICTLFVAVAATVFAPNARAITAITPPTANVLLQLDFSDPSAVTITATDGLSLAFRNNVQSIKFDGLNDSPPPGVVFFLDGSSTLGTEPATTRPLEFFRLFTDGGAELQDLNNNVDDSFAQGQRAFYGQAVFDLSSYPHPLPTSGTGDLIASTSTIIGQWEVVVPEPASLALLGMGGLVVLSRRRR